jgi:hypothetical protein
VKLPDDLSQHSKGLFLTLTEKHKEETRDEVHTLAVVQGMRVHCGIGFQNVIQISSRKFFHVVETARDVDFNGVRNHLRKISWIISSSKVFIVILLKSLLIDFTLVWYLQYAEP